LDIEYVESVLPPKLSASYPHPDWLSSVSMHSSQPWILTGSFDGLARVWNRSGETIATLGGHSKTIKAVEWLGDSKCVTGGHDQKLIVHQFEEMNGTSVLYECIGHKGSVEAIQSLSKRDYVILVL
jgi:ribosome biogenesis protein YTM1